MKKHNKPEWVEDIQKAKSDLRTRHKNQYDLLSRLYKSLTVVDTESIYAQVDWRGECYYDLDYDCYDFEEGLTNTEYREEYIYPDSFCEQYLYVFSFYQSPHTMVENKYELGYSWSHDKGNFLKTEKREVEIRRELNCYLTKTDDYHLEFVTKSPRGGSDYRTTTVSSQLIDASNEEILEADKVYDMYKWLTYNTDHIPTIGEVKTINKVNKVNKADIKPIILILVASFIAMLILYLGMT